MLSASVLTLFLVGLSSLPHFAAASSANNLAGATALDPVQLSIQTKNITAVSSYDLVAYNSSGAPVASYTGQYPRVTLDLPSGTYLFAATAYGPAPDQPMGCCMCAQSGASTISSPPAVKTSPGNSAPAIVLPCYGGNQPLEYGYSLTQVSGSSGLTIDTQPPSSFPATDVSVSVSYKNGTAASGADVYASPVGGYLSWGDNSNLELYAQTGANGVAHLVVPAVPLTVTASESVQVNLTESQKTVQVNIGGQPVNVTVYYSPSYVYLSASALLIPPQTSLSMVLSAQTPYQRILYGAGSASSVSTPNSSQGQPGAQVGAAGAAVAPSDSGSNATAQIAAIPPIPASAHTSSASSQASSPVSSNPSGVTLLAIGTLAIAGAVAAIVGLAISRTRR